MASCNFVQVSPESDFSFQNLPFGVYSTSSSDAHVGVAIGDYVLDLAALAKLGLFSHIEGLDAAAVFSKPYLNDYMALGRPVWRSVRAALQDFLSNEGNAVREQLQGAQESVTASLKEVTMHLPAKIGDYTDFYASREHATNVGVMFRGKDNALMPNWTHLPVGYHGRASSVVVSGTPLHRPNGQRRPDPTQPPVFGPSVRLDYELEMAFFVGPQNELGTPLSLQEAEDRIFGVVLMNDWSARDIQAWEYVPLGPFLGKNFGTTVSPWVVTMDALEPFRVAQPVQDPQPLPYLRDAPGAPASGYDINLEVDIKPAEKDEYYRLTTSNLKYMYWTLKQQLAHHAINGCSMQSGDLCGTGTISGPTEDSFGSMLELSWSGKKDIPLGDSGLQRRFINDHDVVRITGYCQGDGYRVGFGECVGEVFPAKSLNL
ncbi:Fumarylacetoacetase [Martensiomyces pterosporus]|nr:Fumarylacetoacetase [Martensiomyces pterosporus]